MTQTSSRFVARHSCYYVVSTTNCWHLRDCG